MTNSIIIDWAFGRGVRATGDELASFLDACETMRRCRRRDSGHAAAVAKVAALGRWARAYLIVDLVEIVRDRAASEEAGGARLILTHLVEGEDREVRDLLVAALWDLGGGGRARDLMRLVDRAANSWLAAENAANFSRFSEFTDIEVFVAPALILALAGAISGGGAADLDRDAAGERALLAKALDGFYGRFPYLLAIDLALSRPSHVESGAIEKALMPAGTDRSKLAAMPDIVARLVRWNFCTAANTDPSVDTLKQLEHELLTFATFRKTFDVSRTNGVRLTLWLDAVTNLMLDLDAEAAARMLAQSWIPLIHKAQHVPACALPVRRVPPELRLIWSTLSEGRAPRFARFALTADPEAGAGDAGVLLSPWMTERRWERQPSVDRLRWLCGLSVDIQLLELFPREAALAPFALHLMASVDELRRYSKFRGKIQKPWRAADDTEVGDLGWLCGQLRKSALEALDGEGGADLDLLLQLFERAADPEFDFPGAPAAHVEEAEGVLVRTRLAMNALRLVEHAMSTNWRGWNSGWLGVCVRVLDLHAPFLPAGRAPLSDDHILHGLLARYIRGVGKTHEVVDIDVLGEMAALMTRQGEKRLLHRRLFLAPLNDPDEWIGPNESDPPPPFSLTLTRALMRVAAASNNEGFSKKITKTWRSDLLAELRRIAEVQDFDRFARFQLIRMIASGDLSDDDDDDVELLRTALAVTISFGGPLHLRELISALGLQAPASDAHLRVRLEIYGALDALAADEMGELRLDARSVLLDQLKAACLFIRRPEEDDGSEYLVAKALADSRRAKQWSHATAALRMDASGNHRMIDFRHPWVAPDTSSMIAIDESRDAAAVLQPSPAAGALNAFVQTFRSDQQDGSYLGIVEAATEDPRAGSLLQVRYTRGKVASIGDSRDEPAGFGDLVIVESTLPRGAGGREAVQPRRLTSLEDMSAQSSLATVSPVVRGGQPARLRVLLGREASFAWAHASSNFAWLVQPDPPTYEIRMAGDPALPSAAREPILMSLSDLLIEQAREDRSWFFTLALHEPNVASAGGLDGMIFEGLPLRRYLIAPDVALTSGSRKRLAAELARLAACGRDPRGLLVSFRVVADDLGPQLELADEEFSGATPYTELHVPFDERNLWWRSPFESVWPEGSTVDGGATVWATSDRQFYVCDMPKEWPGFPATLKIDVDGRTARAGAFVEIELNTWNPWEASILGTVERMFDLNLPDDEERRAAAILALDQLRPNSAVTLFDPSRTIRDDGRIYCRTSTNLTVLVNAESVSMRVPFDPDTNWRQGREAILAQLDWRARGDPLLIPLSDIPPDALGGDEQARGYLTAVPSDADGPMPCRIAWLRRDGRGIVDDVITLNTVAFGGRRVRPGCRIDAQVSGDRATARLREPFSVAEALWQQDPDVDPAQPRGVYIGSLISGGESFDAYEVGNGRFALSPRPGEHISARRSLQRFFDGNSKTSRADYVPVIDRNFSRGRPAYVRRRALILDSQQETITGTSEGGATAGQLRLTGLQLRRYPTSHEGRFRLERRLHLVSESGRSAIGEDEEEGPPDAEATPRLSVGARLSGRFDPRSRRFYPDEARRIFPRGIEIDVNCLQRAPLGPREYFPGTHAAAKVVEADPPKLSFLETEPSPLEELGSRLVAARERDGSCALDPAELRLVFVGVTERKCDDSDAIENMYLFEWGYGLWVELAAVQVQYRGQAISAAEILLFFGDTIAAAELIYDDGKPCLSIEEIAPSQAHELFLHRRDLKVVHLVDVASARNGAPIITSIRGFDPYAHEAFGTFDPAHARLDPPTEKLLHERLTTSSPQTILARLNTKIFKDSHGKVMLFGRTRMDLTDREAGLQADERIFVQAGTITMLPNDWGLHVHQPPGLHPDDVDPALRLHSESSPMILRRDFSLREQALGDFAALGGPSALEGRQLMVRLVPRGPNLRPDLNQGSLPRNPEIVRQQLRLGREVLATFGGLMDIGQSQEPRLRFELQPGVVVGLADSVIEGTETLLSGDLIRLKLLANGRLQANLASWSDLSFVADGRPAVILPRQRHAKTRALPPYSYERARLSAQDGFSVADLPALTVSACQRSRDGLSRPVTDQAFTEFMTRPHPKFGQLYRRNRNGEAPDLVFTLGLGGPLFAGRLVISTGSAKRGPRVAAQPLDEQGRELPTDWFLVSHRDAAAVEVAESALKGEWYFHDTDTTIWLPKGKGRIQPVPQSVPSITPSRGPLFFGLTPARQASLRHRGGQLVSCASGPQSLLQPLFRAPQVVAAVASPLPDGVLAELWPGRIVQIPAGISRYVARGRRGRAPASIPLQSYDWSLFGPGDRMTIACARRSGILAPTEFELEWAHGPRNGFGPGGALLGRDLRADDVAAGSATYGLGAVRVVVPANDVTRLPTWALIGGAAHVCAPSADDPSLLQGCTVLVFETADHKLGIHGIPKASLFPHRSVDWQQDPWMRGAITSGSAGLGFSRERLLELIRLGGGAIPFTVERFIMGQQPVLYLSRRHQQLHTRDGQFILAQINGEIAGTENVQLCVGARHFAVYASSLVDGVPPDELPFALAALADARRPVWVRMTEAGFVGGHSRNTLATLTVSPICVAAEGDRFLGVVCEGVGDGRLYWLPSGHAAACVLSAQDAQAAFGSLQLERLQVSLRGDGSISITEHPRAIAELAALRLGSSIFVDAIAGSSVSTPFWNTGHVHPSWEVSIVQSQQTSVLFAAAVTAADLKRGSFQSEVAVRQEQKGRINILLTRAGERLTPPVIPRWMLGLEPPPWREAGSARYLETIPGLDGERVIDCLTKGGFMDDASLWEAVALYLDARESSLVLGLGLLAAHHLEGDDRGRREERAVSLIRSIFARSLRSLPQEHLATWAMTGTSRASFPTTFWYERVRACFHGGKLQEARQATERWLNVVRLEGVKPEEEALANAFGVIIGISPNPETLAANARFLPSVIATTRPVYVAPRPRISTVRETIGRLRQQALNLLARRQDIPLGRPVVMR